MSKAIAERPTEPPPQTSLALVTPRARIMAESLVEEAEQRKLLAAYVKHHMIDGTDYGVIPGTKQPALLKPGAEKLVDLFRCTAEFELVEKIEDWSTGLFHYLFRARIVSRDTGTCYAEGFGSANSREGRYRWRNAARKCPACGAEAIIKGKEEYGGGWVCFKKKDGCGAKFDDGDEAIEGQAQGRVENDDIFTLVNCVTPEMRILTRDLRWVPAGDLVTGERLIAVEEEGSQYRRSLRDAEAVVYGRRLDDLFDVRLADGRKVRCNGEHKWLVKKVGGKGTEWVETSAIFQEMQERHGRPRHWEIMSLCSPWTEETSKEAGYMAGLMDADGTFSVGVNGDYQQAIVQFAQQGNGVLARMEASSTARGFAYGKATVTSKLSTEPVYDLRLHGGLSEQMRFLGTIRPPRLLERWRDRFHLDGRRFEGDPVRVECVESVGEGEIVLLGSSALTYIAEGLVAHNTILKMAKKRALVDGSITLARCSDIFTQDVEDLAGEEAPRPHVETNPSKKATPNVGLSKLRDSVVGWLNALGVKPDAPGLSLRLGAILQADLPAINPVAALNPDQCRKVIDELRRVLEKRQAADQAAKAAAERAAAATHEPIDPEPPDDLGDAYEPPVQTPAPPANGIETQPVTPGAVQALAKAARDAGLTWPAIRKEFAATCGFPPDVAEFAALTQRQAEALLHQLQIRPRKAGAA